MASLILISIWLVLMLYNIYKYMFHKPPNFPPGPPRIPLFGSYIFFLLLNYNCFQTAIERICKFYKSSVIGMYFGPFPLLITMDSVSIKEALYKTEFDGRPNILMTQLRQPSTTADGIFFTQGPKWHMQRRFALRHMRDYGFGRRFPDLEVDIRDELQNFIDLIKNGPKYSHEEKVMQDGNILLPHAFSFCFSNCFIKVLTNERMLRQDQQKILDFDTNAFLFLRKTSAFGRLYSILPFLRYICPQSCDYQNAKDSSMNMYKIMQTIVDEHIQSYDANHERSFIDLYIKQMKLAEEENNNESSFQYSQLILTCIDFLFATVIALGGQTSMLIQRLEKHPEVVKKMHEEIDNVIGQGRLPELDDRIHMPYTEATIRESLRIDTLVPSGLPHTVLTSTKFQQYDIPKDTIVFTCLRGMHNDNMLWGDAENFRPDRYLDYSGKLSLKKDYSLPFGAGKRLCAGETFARNMLFVFATTIFQNFNIKSAIGQKIPEKKDNRIGLGEMPPDFWVKLESR